MAYPSVPATPPGVFDAESKYDFRQSNLRSLWIPAIVCVALLSIELYVLFADFNEGVRRRKGPPGAIVATYVTGRNQVRQKTAGNLIWGAPETGRPLYREDAIATMTDSEATVEFADHSQIVIEPESLIIFEEAPKPSAGAPGRILLRLVKGSVLRRKSGAAPLFVQFAKEAAPVRFDDRRGDAVFRVVNRAYGVEVIVESGTVSVNGAPRGPLKLPAPRLKKPRIEIENRHGTAGSLPSRLWSLLWIPSAFAAEEPWVSIHFDWEEVPGAQSYLIQIASDPSFQSILSESRVDHNEFVYRTESPKAETHFYFRVAAIDAAGITGEFSEPEAAEIHPVAEAEPEAPPVKAPAAPPESEPVPAPKPEPPPEAAVKPPPASPPAPITIATAGVPAIARLALDYGLAFESRTFESDASPNRAQGSGFVPALLRAEYYRGGEGLLWIKLGTSVLLEAADSTVSGTTSGRIGTPIYRAWALVGGIGGGLAVGIGPYASTTSSLSWMAPNFVSQTRWLGGALFELSDDPAHESRLHASLRLAPLFTSGLVFDASAAIREPLFSFRPIRMKEYRGATMGLDLTTRWSGTDREIAPAFTLGYVF